MQRRQQQLSPTAQTHPHHSHSDPWALNFICCDAPHAASTSVPSGSHTPTGNYSGTYSNSTSTVTSPINGNGHFPSTHPLIFPSPLGTQSPAGSIRECCNEPGCTSVEYCSNPSCTMGGNRRDGAPDQSQAQLQGGQVPNGMALDQGSDELIKWACSKEGCEAIQQYLECCTLPNCQLPTVPPPNPGVDIGTGTGGHYHISDAMDSMVSGLGGGAGTGTGTGLGMGMGTGSLQAPFHQHGTRNTGHRRQSSLFDGGVDPSNLQNQHSRPSSSSSHFPTQSSSSHQHHNFQLGRQSPHIPSHLHNALHQQLHVHGHAHTHTHMPSPQSLHSHNSHQNRRQQLQQTFQPHNHNHHHNRHSNSHSHSHSHSNSISSLPQSNMPSPDILPWPSNSLSTTPHSSAPTPTSTSTAHTPALMPQMQYPTHICHWSNCHLTFSSMPDLLGHVAADHLGAPGFGPSNPLNPPTAPPPSQAQSPAMYMPQGNRDGGQTQDHQRQLSLQAHQQLQTLSSQQSQSQSQSGLHFSPSNFTSLPHTSTSAAQPTGTTTSSASTSASLPSLSALGFNPSQAEQDRLLSCLWDDCFPLPTICSADEPDQCPPHTHIPAPSECTVTHPHSHTHTHRNASGEPFSPQTMLRHVLEEHLGVPSDILGWDSRDADFGMEALAAGLAVGRLGQGGGSGMVGGELELPPSALGSGKGTKGGRQTMEVNTSAILTDSASDPVSPLQPKPLVCQWHNCSHSEAFNSASELMDHLSECHVGRGKESYACLWGDCAHAHAQAIGGSEDIGIGGSGEVDQDLQIPPEKVQGRLFRSRQKVLRHLQSHTGYRPFVCEVCEQAFSEAAPLAAHIRRHNEEKPFLCEVEGCGKRFAISSSLTIHMRTHNGDKPFICPHCQKGFVEASNLTKHIRTHTGERPFACPHPGCGKRFPRPDQLKRHVGIHDKERDRERGKVAGQGKVGVGKGKTKGSSR